MESIESYKASSLSAAELTKLAQINEAFKYTGLPAFCLNKIRRRARGFFIESVNAGKIRLEKVVSCSCGVSDLHKVASQDRFGLPFNTLICRGCGLLITSPRVCEQDMPEYYRTIYHPLVVGIGMGKEASNYSFSDDQGSKIYSYILPLLKHPTSNEIKVFEIGCAAGSNLLDFAENARKQGVECKLFGTEYEESLAQIASTKGVEMAKDWALFRNTPVKFDVIIMSHVLEHFTDPVGSLNAIKSLLEDDGLLYVEVPGLMNQKMMDEWYDSNFLDYLVHAHTFNFNLSSMKNLVNRAGFRFLKGDEVVRGVFMPNAPHAYLVEDGVRSNYNDILTYLENNFVGAAASKCKIGVAKYIYRAVRKFFGQFYYAYIQTLPDMKGGWNWMSRKSSGESKVVD